jgi:Cu-processing system permease protein
MRSVVVVLAVKELRDAVRNRWLWLFAGAFAALAGALGLLALSETAGVLGYSRTVAGLINLVLLLVPLFGLLQGAQAVASEREAHTLAFLLAQPISRVDLLVGKFLGQALGLTAALGLGFGLASLVLTATHVDALVYVAIAGAALLLALAMLSLGMLLSVMARRAAVALRGAVVAWFVLVLVADLGLLGTTMALRLPADALFLLALSNPLQVFKLAAVLAIRPDLEVLGPAGLYGVATFGAWLAPLLVLLLTIWIALPLLLASALFQRRSEI